MGFAVPASIGVEMANPALRPFVLVGDGAFQMTGTELSTAVRLGLKPIVLVLNNDGYGTMRKIRDGCVQRHQPMGLRQDLRPDRRRRSVRGRHQGRARRRHPPAPWEATRFA